MSFSTTFKMRDLSARERIDREVNRMISHPALQHYSPMFLIGLRTLHDDTLSNHPYGAWTDGLNEWYVSGLIDQFSNAQIRTVLMHEVLHKIYAHGITYLHLYKKCSDTASRACDFFNNLAIMEMNTKLSGTSTEMLFEPLKWQHDGGWRIWLYDEVYRGLTPQEIFDLLIDQENDSNGDDNSDDSGDGSGDDSSDDSGDDSSDDSGDGDGTEGNPTQASFDEHDNSKFQDMTEEERDAALREMEQMVRQAQLAASLTGAGGKLDLEFLEPQVDWRKALRDFVRTTCSGRDLQTWRRLNRRFQGQRIAMPSAYSEKAGPLAICPDMSGSTNSFWGLFAAECASVAVQANPEEVHLLYWDTRVGTHEVYTPNEYRQLANKTKPSGGGGTTVSCVPKYMRKHDIKPQAAIVLTDGDVYGGNWGTWDCPVLWIIVSKRKVTPPFGKVLHIDPDTIR